MTRKYCATKNFTDNTTLQCLIGKQPRIQQLWMFYLALPLVLPVSIPGMATTVGALSLVLAWALYSSTAITLPTILANRRIPEAVISALSRVERVIKVLLTCSRPRLIQLSSTRFSYLNAGMLAIAGSSMMIPLPLVPFDNIVPAMALSMLSLGLFRRDGLFLCAGYILSILAWVYVGSLYWAGATILHQGFNFLT